MRAHDRNSALTAAASRVVAAAVADSRPPSSAAASTSGDRSGGGVRDRHSVVFVLAVFWGEERQRERLRL
jgi:hypothetical protein